MKNFGTYYIVVFFGILILIQVGKIIFILFEPKFLDRPLFRPPKKKGHFISYYVAAIFVLLFYILVRLKVI